MARMLDETALHDLQSPLLVVAFKNLGKLGCNIRKIGYPNTLQFRDRARVVRCIHVAPSERYCNIGVVGVLTLHGQQKLNCDVDMTLEPEDICYFSLSPR